MSLLPAARAIERESQVLTEAAVENFPRVALDSIRSLKRYVDEAQKAAVDAAMADGCDAAEVRDLLGLSDGR